VKAITRQKPIEEIATLLDRLDRTSIIGCGTCATMTRTGGRDEVLEMKERLEGLGKLVTGWTVIPIACDEMTGAALQENSRAVESANSILVMSCALGVQRVASYLDRQVFPALDTLFIGIEDAPGSFSEACAQCGQCILGYTAGVCPITACHKQLLNGPCGGTSNGRCEVDRNRDCAWTLIYERLKAQGRLDLMRVYHPPRNFQVMPRPRVLAVGSREGGEAG
jgi:ferredoxin